MQDVVLVRVLHRACQLNNQFHCRSDRHRLTLEHRIELSAFDQAHAEVASAIALADLINWNDAGMIQSGGRFRFATEPFYVRFRGPMTQGDYLQCHDAVKTFLPDTVNHALAAPTDFFQQLVITELDRRTVITWDQLIRAPQRLTGIDIVLTKC